MDVFSKAKRSEVMAAIRGKGNRSTERSMAAMLRSRGLSGWRLQPQGVPGCPDFFFEQRKLALFIDGCFWHACPKCSKLPAHNRRFWRAKLGNNVRRDRAVRRCLNRRGISVIRLWEHDLEKMTRRCIAVLSRLASPEGATAPTSSSSS